jgi:hypothetical protein
VASLCEGGAAAAGAGDHNGDDQQQGERQHAEADQRLPGMDGHVADDEKDFVHGALLTDSVTPANEERTFMVNQQLMFKVNKAPTFVVNQA